MNHWKADKQPVALECSAGKDGAGRVSRVLDGYTEVCYMWLLAENTSMQGAVKRFTLG